MDELQTSELLRQTGRIRWSELQRTFAQGRLLLVADGLDLIAIAKAIIDDATEKVEPLLAGQQIGHIAQPKLSNGMPMSRSSGRLWLPLGC